MATDGEYRIFVPKDLREGIMEWYHLALMHPGAGRMEASIRRCFTWPNCREDVRNYVKNCDECQRYKATNKKHFGKIPLKEETKQNAFDTLTVDLYGPWPFVATIQERKEMGKNKQGKEKKIKL